jgi:hypothetical protein
MKIKGKICEHCGMDTAIRNPSGYCDHLYYPEYCKVCKSKWRLKLFKFIKKLKELLRKRE